MSTGAHVDYEDTFGDDTEFLNAMEDDLEGTTNQSNGVCFFTVGHPRGIWVRHF